MITIAVDCMGGDHGPSVTLPACRHFLDKHADAQLLLVGLQDSVGRFSHHRAKAIAATEVVGMDDPLEVALRRKKDSSMRVAIQQVKDGIAQAAVSAGNTAALMACCPQSALGCEHCRPASIGTSLGRPAALTPWTPSRRRSVDRARSS